jgi:3',5'-cyclic AMP phosphodiesterase CpdA
MSLTVLAQLTDVHIRAPGKLAYGRVDTAAFLREAVDTVMRLRQRPIAIVLTGDLTDFATPEEYAHLAQLLAPLPMPLYLLPGNHDDRDALRRAFPSHSYLGTSGFIQYAVDVADALLIGLDTTEPRKSSGALCDERLAWLRDTLSKNQGRRTIIAMHHPPFRTFIGHMDDAGLLRGARELEAIVAAHPQVERILCGHLHRSIDVRFGGTIAMTSPSPAHQVDLDLKPDAPSRWSLEPPAFRLVAWEANERMVSHLAPCGRFDGPHPFHEEGGRLID